MPRPYKQSEEQLTLRMLAIITQRPITLRNLTRKFSMNHQATIERFCRESAALGQLVMTGTGKKGSPITVRLPE
jgi:hypothetical protein